MKVLFGGLTVYNSIDCWLDRMLLLSVIIVYMHMQSMKRLILLYFTIL